MANVPVLLDLFEDHDLVPEVLAVQRRRQPHCLASTLFARPDVGAKVDRAKATLTNGFALNVPSSLKHLELLFLARVHGRVATSAATAQHVAALDRLALGSFLALPRGCKCLQAAALEARSAPYRYLRSHSLTPPAAAQTLSSPPRVGGRLGGAEKNDRPARCRRQGCVGASVCAHNAIIP